MGMRRMTRLTNGFSNRLKSLRASVAFFICYYNFVRIHTTLRVTPALQAGIADHVWSMEELVAVALGEEPIPFPENRVA